MKKAIALALTALLLLPLLPLAAQPVDRCAENPPALPSLRRELAERREELTFARQPDHISFVTQRIKSLEEKLDWGVNNGVGNGWIADARNTCILYVSASGEPVLGTRIYFYDATRALPAKTAETAQTAMVASGPARIRSGPGTEHPRLRWCNTGWPLTVWLPAVDGWLRASCFGANGWIHESLVKIGEEEIEPDTAPSAVTDQPLPPSGQPAVVTNGPAHIRSGPGQEHPHYRWCGIGWPLTVWPPAQNGWLRASCYGANGWIHESLVRTDAQPTEPEPAPAAVSDQPLPPGGQPAVVTNGPVHIRSGPGQEHPHVRWCGTGWPLTVWPPAQNGWLRASCFGANGWIHESLIRTG